MATVRNVAKLLNRPENEPNLAEPELSAAFDAISPLAYRTNFR